MTSKKIVVTGAHSYLGQKLLRHLTKTGGFEIAAFITPWADEKALVTGRDIKYFKVDLRESFDEAAAATVRNAESILHFAWVRGKDAEKVLGQNLSMFENLREHISRPERLVFISSVAASPQTLSTYGKTKFMAANLLAEYGAVILVTGLIVDKVPKGPYKLLVEFVKKLPLRVRFTKDSVRVYPISTDDFLNAVTTVISRSLPSGSYRVYPSDAADINDFLAELERRHTRARIPFPISYRLSMSSLKLFRRLGLLPSTIGEKLLTFLYKDEEYLARHKALPDNEFDRPLSEMI
jgi:nucleoside-diphosphate-sugar epimerase